MEFEKIRWLVELGLRLFSQTRVENDNMIVSAAVTGVGKFCLNLQPHLHLHISLVVICGQGQVSPPCLVVFLLSLGFILHPLLIAFLANLFQASTKKKET